VRALLHELDHGDTRRAHRFRYALLAFDLGALLYVTTTSFHPRSFALEIADALIGLVLLAEFAARHAASPAPWRGLLHPVTVADAAAVVSFLAPIPGEGAGFLRALRTLRLLRAPTRPWPGCAGTSRPSAATRRWCSRRPTSRCSSSS
jgi:voltage-gated potassium channel